MPCFYIESFKHKIVTIFINNSIRLIELNKNILVHTNYNSLRSY